MRSGSYIGLRQRSRVATLAQYLVTGGAGFIGSHLVDALMAHGHGVNVLDDFSTGRIGNLPADCVVQCGDVADPAAVHRAMQGVAGCFHLAAVASVARANEDWLGTHRTNLTGTITVLDEARQSGGLPVVYASSAAVYGDLAEVAHEGMAPSPLTAYGADKLGSELHARVASRVHGVPTMGLRFFNVYGPRQDPASPYSGVISIFADAIRAGRRVRIDGDGGQTRDFVYVADVVSHLVAAMEKLQGDERFGVFNVCTGQETSVLELAALLARQCGRPHVLDYGPARPGDIRRSVGSNARAAAALGVKARSGLPDGLRSTLAALARAKAAHVLA